MSGRVTRYALFQCGDYVRERGVPLLLVGALLLLMAQQGALGPGGVDLGGTELRTLATAALFLERFVSPATRWAHFDIMAWNVSSRPGRPEGGEAMGLRAVYAAIAELTRRTPAKKG